MAAHARLSASGAHRWMACPASVDLEADYHTEPGEAAAEGTAAHFVAETCLKEDREAISCLGQVIEVDGYKIKITEDFADFVQQYVDYVRSLPGSLLVEQRVPFDDYVPGGFGTADAVVLGDDGHVYVVDLKFGRGVNVSAENNKQAMLYALGVYQTFSILYDVEHFTLVIHQPRIDGVSEWQISAEELLAWVNTELLPAVEAVEQDSPIFNPGDDQCKFCKAKAACPALAQFVLETARAEFASSETESLPVVSGREPLTLEDIAGLLPHTSLIKDWADSLWARAQEAALKGETIPGHKLVIGQTRRRWTDEEDLAAALKKVRGHKVDDLLPRSPLPIGKMEKMLGKDHKILAEYAVAPEGAPKLVPETDKRDAIVIDPLAGFKELAA
ncbi:MAG: DUF2800 domain-containing protein [Pseudomonadota bacterium]